MVMPLAEPLPALELSEALTVELPEGEPESAELGDDPLEDEPVAGGADAEAPLLHAARTIAKHAAPTRLDTALLFMSVPVLSPVHRPCDTAAAHEHPTR